MSVHIRYRKTQNGYSAYLDIYHKGKRTYEYPEIIVSKDYSNLKNYLKEDKTNMEFVEKLRDKISLQIKEGKYGFAPAYLRNADFIAYFEKIAAEKKHYSYVNSLNKLKAFAKYGRLPLSEVNENLVKDFIKYLRHDGLSETSCRHYLNIMNIVLNCAVQERIIEENPIKFVPKELKPKKQKAQREYLTIDEIRQLNNTPFPVKNPRQIKEAFLFACYTGLRVSDLLKLTHSDIVDGVIQYRQKKSKRDFHYLPLNKTAKEILNSLAASEYNNNVFYQLPAFASYPNRMLKLWGAQAGIKKNIHWHVARHTFAVFFLSSGGDIYTLKELLGHTELATTEVYGKIVNSRKVELINNLPSLQTIKKRAKNATVK